MPRCLACERPDCSTAIERIVDAIAKGTIEQGTAKLLLDAIQAQMKSIEQNNLELRLAELEKMAATVDLGAQRR